MSNLSDLEHRLDRRKQANDITTCKMSLFPRLTSGSHSGRPSRDRWFREAKDNPTNTAIMKRELTLTRSSRAFRWTSVMSSQMSSLLELDSNFTGSSKVL